VILSSLFSFSSLFTLIHSWHYYIFGKAQSFGGNLFPLNKMAIPNDTLKKRRRNFALVQKVKDENN
jgi:hypothetical protein